MENLFGELLEFSTLIIRIDFVTLYGGRRRFVDVGRIYRMA